MPAVFFSAATRRIREVMRSRETQTIRVSTLSLVERAAVFSPVVPAADVSVTTGLDTCVSVVRVVAPSGCVVSLSLIHI